MNAVLARDYGMNDKSALPRDQFMATSTGDQMWFEVGELTVTSSDNGVLVAVEQEQAVDSYNKSFTCQCLLSRHDAEGLRDFLIRVLS